jgi:hypothetical protein
MGLLKTHPPHPSQPVAVAPNVVRALQASPSDAPISAIAKLRPLREPLAVGQGNTREQWLQQSREALAPVLADTDRFLQRHNLTRRTEGLTGYLVIEGKPQDLLALLELDTLETFTLDQPLHLIQPVEPALHAAHTHGRWDFPDAPLLAAAAPAYSPEGQRRTLSLYLQPQPQGPARLLPQRAKGAAQVELHVHEAQGVLQVGHRLRPSLARLPLVLQGSLGLPDPQGGALLWQSPPLRLELDKPTRTVQWDRRCDSPLKGLDASLNQAHLQWIELLLGDPDASPDPEDIEGPERRFGPSADSEGEAHPARHPREEPSGAGHALGFAKGSWSNCE